MRWSVAGSGANLTTSHRTREGGVDVDADLVVYYVIADEPGPTGTDPVSPPFADADEARTYQSEYGGAVWRFPVRLDTGELVSGA